MENAQPLKVIHIPDSFRWLPPLGPAIYLYGSSPLHSSVHRLITHLSPCTQWDSQTNFPTSRKQKYVHVTFYKRIVWKETGVLRGNSHRHKVNIQTPGSHSDSGPQCSKSSVWGARDRTCVSSHN